MKAKKMADGRWQFGLDLFPNHLRLTAIRHLPELPSVRKFYKLVVLSHWLYLGRICGITMQQFFYALIALFL
jgi:hypothetical protein